MRDYYIFNNLYNKIKKRPQNEISRSDYERTETSPLRDGKSDKKIEKNGEKKRKYHPIFSVRAMPAGADTSLGAIYRQSERQGGRGGGVEAFEDGLRYN